MNPQTVEEWGRYVSTLSGEALWSKGVAANTLAFVMDLQTEGKSGDEIVDILLLFALQFERDGQALPVDMPGQYLPYPALLESAGESP